MVIHLAADIRTIHIHPFRLGKRRKTKDGSASSSLSFLACEYLPLILAGKKRKLSHRQAQAHLPMNSLIWEERIEQNTDADGAVSILAPCMEMFSMRGQNEGGGVTLRVRKFTLPCLRAIGSNGLISYLQTLTTGCNNNILHRGIVIVILSITIL